MNETREEQLARMERAEGERMRHLHWSAEDRYSLCGYARWVPVRVGSRVLREPGHPSVHVSKARRSDCAQCRALLRESVRQQRAYYEARKLEEDCDRERVVMSDGEVK